MLIWEIADFNNKKYLLCGRYFFIVVREALIPLGTYFSFIEMYTPAAGYDIIYG